MSRSILRPVVSLSIASLVVAAWATQAGAQAPTVSAPLLLPGDTAIAAAAGNQSAPALALGSDTILAVWADSRSSPITTGQQSGLDIWAVRLDASGAPIDPTPFPVTMAGGDQKSPRMAWNGSHWLVAWVGQL
jgi:hypothetical protein